MRALLTFLIAVLGYSVSAAPVRTEIRAALQGVIPQNWVVAESAGFLLISNRNEVTFYNAVSMNGTDLERDRQARVSLGKKGHFIIKITIGPSLSQGVYDDIRRTLPRRMHRNKPEIPFQEYYSIRDDALPDGYGPGYSVYISTDRHPYFLVWPESADREWQRVLTAVQQVFDRYRETPLVQPDGAANRSQPIHSQTNRGSAAAG